MRTKYLSWVFLSAEMLCAAALDAGTPTSPNPTLDQVKTAAEILWKSDCTKDSVRKNEALKTMQYAIDHVTPAEYIAFYMQGSRISPASLKKLYEMKPLFYYYDRSFDKVLNELKKEKTAPGKVTIWLLYNMGLIVKTDKHCFGIDIHHRRAEELIPYLEFVLVTHNHSDHMTVSFLHAMNRAKKKVYSNFFPSYGGYSKEPERMITHGDLTIWTYETDHNVKLKKFVMPFEIVCGREPEACVIYHSGDSSDAKRLKHHSKKIDFHLVHPYNRLNVAESAGEVLKPEVTLIGHLQEMHHKFDQARWTYVHGYNAAEKVRAVGKTAWVPMWGEKIVWKHCCPGGGSAEKN